MRKKIFIFFLVILLISVCVFLIFSRRPKNFSDDISWGLTFSKYSAERYNPDWKANYLAILDELRPRRMRIIFYWEDLEPEPGNYLFRDYDWMVAEAEKRNIDLILVMGQSVGSDDKCYFPEWYKDDQKEIRESKTLALLKALTERYQDSPRVTAFQLEERPLGRGKECNEVSLRFFQKEIETIKRLDPDRKIILTDSVLGTRWLWGSFTTDELAVTEKIVLGEDDGSRVLNWFFKHCLWFKKNIYFFNWRDKNFSLYNFKASPEIKDQAWNKSLEEQLELMDLNRFQAEIKAVEALGISPVYLNGAEWWYSLKKEGMNGFWEQAGNLLEES